MVKTLFKKPEYIEQIIDLNKDEYTINQIENIIKNEKEKTIDKNEDNENNIDIKSNESSTSNFEYDINKLQRILDGKEDIKTNLVILLETLHKKIILNEQKVKEDFIEFGVEEKNSEYFYNSWLKSFNKEKYKIINKYKHFIKKKEILPLKDMGKNILKLLEVYEINIYVEDPGNFDNNITKEIDSYNIKNDKVIYVKN